MNFMNLVYLIRCAVSIICFTILAIVFHKWWIIFFTLIFWGGFSVKPSDDE